MKTLLASATAGLLGLGTVCFQPSLPYSAAESVSLAGSNPAGELPPHIRRLMFFGERADWSHDGKKILFIEKTYGDACEVEVATGRITPVTHHYPHIKPTAPP